MDLNEMLWERLDGLVASYRDAYLLEDWTIRVQVGPVADEEAEDPHGVRAACHADPEYREATLGFNVEAWKTGDDIEEMVAHEMAHPVLWPLSHVAEILAGEDPRLQEWVRIEMERVTTDVGQAFYRLMRRIRELEGHCVKD